MFRGKRPVVVLSYCKYTTFILTTKENIFYFAFSYKKSFFWFPAKLFLANFRFNGLSLPGRVLYPLKQNNSNTGRKTGKNKNGVATLGYNPRFRRNYEQKTLIPLSRRIQYPIFPYWGFCLRRQSFGSLLSGFSKGTPKTVYT